MPRAKVECPDCGERFDPVTDVHDIFCRARTCDGCDTTFSYVLQTTGGTIEIEGEDGKLVSYEERMCPQCLGDDVEREDEDDDQG